MPGFFPLFSIKIIHGFYPDAPARDLEFKPVGNTMGRMFNARLLLRKSHDGIHLFYDSDHTEALTAMAADESDPLSFDFKLISTNPLFTNFTVLTEKREGKISYLNSQSASKSGNGDYRLTADDALSEADLKEMDSHPLKGLLSRADQLMPPICFISVRVRKEGLLTPKVYDLPFERRQTLWRYLLLGKYARDDLSIVDQDGGIRFLHKEQEVLPGNRVASVLESDTPIPLGSGGKYRFQLRRKNGQSDAVLIRQLASAPLDRVNVRSGKGNSKEFFSEIFINP